jgi:Flp pilus assembly secretin CpaC
MKPLLAAALMAFAITAFAQQQTTPPATTPPTFPQPDKDAGRQMPPDMVAKAPSSTEVQQQITDKISTEPGLADANVKVRVTISTVTLSGTVHDAAQHKAARQIAESYAGPRKIVDQVRIKEK